MSLGLILFLMIFMGLRELLRTINLICFSALIISIAFRIASSVAEKIEYSHANLYVMLVFLNMIVKQLL